jgi:hypothetical protein
METANMDSIRLDSVGWGGGGGMCTKVQIIRFTAAAAGSPLVLCQWNAVDSGRFVCNLFSLKYLQITYRFRTQ